MSVRTAAVAVVGALATGVRAHGSVTGFKTNGVWNQGFLVDYYYQKVNTGSFPDVAGWYAENLDLGFVEPNAFGTAAINCHKNAAPGAVTASVPAGGTVEFEWSDWPHGLGPVLTYVAACGGGDCTAADPEALAWVKIDEAGIDYGTQQWAAQRLINQNNTWTTTVPAGLAPGNYVFRHEIIALHGGSAPNGAQAYPQCINIAVTGSGTDRPAGTPGVDLYKADDPGILINPYTTITNYVIPGPELYTG
jgi:cellulase